MTGPDLTAAPARADLAYGPLDEHRFDLYLPSADRRPPVAVYVHGGGWFTGDKSWVRDEEPVRLLARTLLDAGWAVAAVNYRLSGAALFPEPVGDVARAVRHVVAHAEELGIDAGRVALVGDSAGANLALLAAYTDELPASAVVSYYGVLDLLGVPAERRAMAAAGTVRGFFPPSSLSAPTPEGRFLGVEPDDAAGTALARAASPRWVATSAAPATLVVAGAYDAMAGPEGARATVARLVELGVDCELVLVEAGHGETTFMTDPTVRTRLLRFLARHAGDEHRGGGTAGEGRSMSDLARFDEELPGLVGEHGTLRRTLAAMGDETFDVERYVTSQQGCSFLENNVLLDHADGMSPEVLDFWRHHGRGLVKQLHDAGGDEPWYSYVPVSASEPADTDRRYPLILQVNRKPDTVAETYGHVFEAAWDEAIVVIPQARTAMPGFVTDPSRPVFGRDHRDLPPTEDLWRAIERAKAELPVDPSRVYVAGFSFPGFRAVAHAFNHPEQVAGLIVDAFLYPFVWDLPSNAVRERAASMRMPMINVAGLCDYGHPYPVYLAQHAETNNGHDHDRTSQEAHARAELWLQVNGCAPVPLAHALATADLPDARAAERAVGLPSASSSTVQLAGTAHHVVDLPSLDGVVRTRLVAVENVPHWPHAAFARLGWRFVRHFSRDQATGESVWDGVPEPRGLSDEPGQRPVW